MFTYTNTFCIQKKVNKYIMSETVNKRELFRIHPFASIFRVSYWIRQSVQILFLQIGAHDLDDINKSYKMLYYEFKPSIRNRFNIFLAFSYLINFLCIFQIDQCKCSTHTTFVFILLSPKMWLLPNFGFDIFMRLSEKVVQISDSKHSGAMTYDVWIFMCTNPITCHATVIRYTSSNEC